MRLALIAPFAFALLATLAPASAQEPSRPTAPGHWPAVLELAQVLGQAQWIRILCNGDEDQTWRTYMQDMLELEGHEGGQHTQLVSAFNQGFRQMRASYRTCTEDMKAVEGRLAARGKDLSDQIARSYLD